MEIKTVHDMKIMKCPKCRTFDYELTHECRPELVTLTQQEDCLVAKANKMKKVKQTAPGIEIEVYEKPQPIVGEDKDTKPNLPPEMSLSEKIANHPIMKELIKTKNSDRVLKSGTNGDFDVFLELVFKDDPKFRDKLIDWVSQFGNEPLEFKIKKNNKKGALRLILLLSGVYFDIPDSKLIRVAKPDTKRDSNVYWHVLDASSAVVYKNQEDIPTLAYILELLDYDEHKSDIIGKYYLFTDLHSGHIIDGPSNP